MTIPDDLRQIVTVNGIKFTGGRGSFGIGGAIVNEGKLSINNCLFSGNQSEKGGAIFNGDSGQLNVGVTEFFGNSAVRFPNQNLGNPLQGGAIYNIGLAQIDSCSFVLNTAGENGGAIYNGMETIGGQLK